MGAGGTPPADSAPSFGGWLKLQAGRKPKGRFGRFLIKWTERPPFMMHADLLKDNVADALEQLEQRLSRHAYRTRGVGEHDKELIEDRRGLQEAWARYAKHCSQGRSIGRYA